MDPKTLQGIIDGIKAEEDEEELQRQIEEEEQKAKDDLHSQNQKKQT